LVWRQAQRLYNLLEGTLSCWPPSNPAWVGKMRITFAFQHAFSRPGSPYDSAARMAQKYSGTPTVVMKITFSDGTGSRF
jgi:hypothetical protein